MYKPISGEKMLETLLDIELTDEAAKRMLWCARQYGLVNFPHKDELFGLKYADGLYTLGEPDFSNVR